MTRYSYGRSLKILAQGQVSGSQNNASFEAQRTFDGSQLTIERVAKGRYKISFPSTWVEAKDSYIVMVTGCGYAQGASGVIKASVSQRELSHFIVDTSSDYSRADGSFFFQMTNLNDWGT